MTERYGYSRGTGEAGIPFPVDTSHKGMGHPHDERNIAPPPPVDNPGLNITNFNQRFPGYAYLLKLGDRGLLEIVNNWITEYHQDESEYWTSTASEADKVEVLQGMIEQSGWYINHDEVARAALMLEHTDPATWQQSYDENEEEILRAATAMGVNVDDRLDELVRTSLLEGWMKEELEEELASEMYAPNLKPSTGSVRALYNGLLGFTKSQLTTLTADQLWKMAWDIKRGDNTLENMYQEINQSAANDWDLTDFDLHSQYQQNGTTMASRLRGVHGTIANLWDVSTDELDLMDLGPSRLVVTDGENRRLMNSQEAALMARQDDRFLTSSTYQRELGQIGSGLMRMMG